MFTELPNEIIILIAKYDVTPLALIIVSKKIYNILNKKQIQTKKYYDKYELYFIRKNVY